MNITAVIPCRHVPNQVLVETVASIQDYGYMVAVSEENSLEGVSIPHVIYCHNSTDRVWNRSRVLNFGIRHLPSDIEVVLVVDAYCRPMDSASKEHVESLLKEGIPVGRLYREDGKIYYASLGMIAFLMEDYSKVGGYDETYEGWGLEDIDFAARLSKLKPLLRAIEFHYLNHPKFLTDQERWNKYHARNYEYWLKKNLGTPEVKECL